MSLLVNSKGTFGNSSHPPKIEKNLLIDDSAEAAAKALMSACFL
jgi:hypothetical protein